MYVRERKEAWVVALTEVGMTRFNEFMGLCGLRTRSAAIMHMARNVVRMLGEMKMPMRRCTDCRPLAADERVGTVVLMLTPRERAYLRVAVSAVGVADLGEFIEGALMLSVPERG